jgi:hypothetical protein
MNTRKVRAQKALLETIKTGGPAKTGNAAKVVTTGPTFSESFGPPARVVA